MHIAKATHTFHIPASKDQGSCQLANVGLKLTDCAVKKLAGYYGYIEWFKECLKRTPDWSQFICKLLSNQQPSALMGGICAFIIRAVR